MSIDVTYVRGCFFVIGAIVVPWKKVIVDGRFFH
jgi:hypothetical protein